jgi:hypothetical protein
MTYESTLKKASTALPGVSFVIRKISLASRMELVKRLREEGAALAFHEAGDSLEDRMRAAELNATLEAIYVKWGTVSIQGLTIDGKEATPEGLVAGGPEALCREIAAAVRKECFLDEDERKN